MRARVTLRAMEHRAYPKIATVDPSAFTSGRWVATEKIHGANMVVATDGTSVRFGKRKAWLDERESFFGWQLLRASLTAAVVQAHRSLGAPGVLRVYGELFGGRYPHPEVAAVPGCAPVQTGIWYAPDLRFAAFDALWAPDDGDETFLAWSALVALGEGCGVAVVPVLGVGARSELRALPVRYESRVAPALELLLIAGNVAEGFVLKPEGAMAPALRPMAKHKIQEFDEQDFKGALPWPADARLSLDELITLGRRLINPPRRASARSKLGEVDDHVLADEVALDVRVDLEGAFPQALSSLSVEHEDALHAALRELAMGT